MRKLKTGDPCPCCGQPILLTAKEALETLAFLADILGLPELPEQPGKTACGQDG